VAGQAHRRAGAKGPEAGWRAARMGGWEGRVGWAAGYDNAVLVSERVGDAKARVSTCTSWEDGGKPGTLEGG